MVNPTSLYGAGCEAAVPAATADAKTKAANTPILIENLPVELDVQLSVALRAISLCEGYHGP